MKAEYGTDQMHLSYLLMVVIKTMKICALLMFNHPFIGSTIIHVKLLGNHR